jgi:cation:H+ antiporter
MDILMNLLIFIISLAVLLKASDWFVASAENIGLSFGVSPFIIGVTIVAFGTSLPELATSIAAVYSGSSEIVVGNVVGSNITNILLVLGLTAIIGKKIVLDYDMMDVDIPMLVISAFLFLFMIYDLHITIFEAIILLAALVIFLLNSFKNRDEDQTEHKASMRDYVLLLVGGVLVYFGANYTIFAVEGISKTIGIDPDIIALTVIALGTSLPEVVVSIAAARKGKTSIAVGNVLGSNIFNTYAVMGIPALFTDLTIPESMKTFNIPFMVAVTIMFAMSCMSRQIHRWEGVLFVLAYLYFIGDLASQVL